MSWASKRQFFIGAAVIIFLLLVIGTPVYFKFFNNPPTCFDSKQNQNETGVDCGGICARACINDVVPLPVQIWARAFQVSKGVYNLVAYVQNPNVDYVAGPSHFLFKVYDAEGVQIGFRDGYADVPPNKTYPVFEQTFPTGDRIPTKVFFEYLTGFEWKKNPASQNASAELEVREARAVPATTGERIEATLVNQTVYEFRKTEVVALVYDKDGNAMASSRTFVDIIAGKATVPLVFTWPQKFSGEISKIEIVPKLPVRIQ